MMSEIIDAIIAFVGVIVSVTVSFIVSIGVNRYNYHHLFAETVSQSRNRWLAEMRGFISDMLANKRREIYGNINDSNVIEVCTKYDSCKFQVLMRLNTEESDHRQLRALIMKLDDFKPNNKKDIEEKDIEEYKMTELAIIEISKRIFKEEWEKVKIEAKGEEK